MREISAEQVRSRLTRENPWWDGGGIGATFEELSPRAYFDLFLPLVESRSVRRAVVLLGPRRVGKTVLLHHAIQALLESGVDPERIAYFSVDHPLYNNLGLEDLLQAFWEATGTRAGDPQWVFFDEIQYLREWEVHLKRLVDDHDGVKAVVSGSAAAALRLKSQESGAGRFTDFLLPPLTFYEYLDLLGDDHPFESTDVEGRTLFWTPDIHGLNEKFLHYLNFGGYPEVIFSEEIQADPGRFIKSDIIDKVLLRDLPSLYGISDIQELNQLFTALAFNTAGEVSLQELASNSGVTKATLKRYIEYLEAAFLIKVVHRVDRSAKKFKRARQFKVYLTNPSLRAALFSPTLPDRPEDVGALAETAIFSQWFHDPNAELHYARWRSGEVDIVKLNPNMKAAWAVEVKWSDRFPERPSELGALHSFCNKNGLTRAWATSKTIFATCRTDGLQVDFIPAAVYCYTLGHNIVHDRSLAGVPA